jgi:uncharacterized repeat protein (TIGR03803 family)
MLRITRRWKDLAMSRQTLSLFAGLLAAAAVLDCPVAQAASETTVYTFCKSANCTDGNVPIGGLVNVGGVLYGTTQYGGKGRNGGFGVVFGIDPGTGTETLVHKFAKSNGLAPYAGMVELNGLLYGTTMGGGGAKGTGLGTVFSFDPATDSLTTVYAFQSTEDGVQPMASLTVANGELYGTTKWGGTTDAGTVFAVDPNSGTETVLHSFQDDGVDGFEPTAGLFPMKGVLYGTTPQGGANGDGTVYKIDPNTGSETVLHAFGGTDGAYPDASLIAVKGMLYGTTVCGGANNGGTVFSLDPKTGAETVVYSFCKEQNCTDGRTPAASLIDVKGTLYGTTIIGGTNSCGTNNCGTVFSLDPKTGAETVLYSFCSQENCTDGLLPQSSLIDVNGMLFGSTPYDTMNTCQHPDGYCGGVVFSLKP